MDTPAPPLGRDLVLDFWRGIGILMVLLHHLVYFHIEAFRNFAAAAAGSGLLEQGLWW
mgnify:CR=1 FL=1